MEIGLERATDSDIVARAITDDRIIVSSDTDFGAILARRTEAKPSFVLLRYVNELTPEQHAELLVANLPAIATDLEAGAVATFARGTIRLRHLPFGTE